MVGNNFCFKLGGFLELLDIIIGELRFTKKNFIWATLLIAIVTCVCLFLVVFVEGHTYYSNIQRSQKESVTKEKMNAMLDEYKSITDNLRHTIHIIPKDVVKEGFYSKGYSHKEVSNISIQKLLKSFKEDIAAIIPLYRQKSFWNENSRSFMAASVSSDAIIHKLEDIYYGYKQVKPGFVALGYEIHRNENAKVGNKILINGKEYVISNCIDQQGAIDDITVWFNSNDINLDKKSKLPINEIWIWDNSLSVEGYNEVFNKISNMLYEYDIKSMLPSKILKFKALNASSNTAEKSIKQEKNFFKIEERSISLFFHILLIISSVSTMILTTIAILNNSIKRKKEIALLQSIGMNKHIIYKLFIFRNIIVIFCGVALGVILSISLGSLLMFLLWGMLYINLITILKFIVLIIFTGLLMSAVSIFITTRFEPASILITE